MLAQDPRRDAFAPSVGTWYGRAAGRLWGRWAYAVSVAVANVVLVVAVVAVPGTAVPQRPLSLVSAAPAPVTADGGMSVGTVAVVALLLGLGLVVFWRAVIALVLAALVGAVLFVVIMIGVWAGGGAGNASGEPGDGPATVVRTV